MKTAAGPVLSALVRDQISRPSPIRQIMKMAEPQNIRAMGLDPAQVISFGGGWVNHEAPEEFRQAYQSVVNDADIFHKSGAYTATLGDSECREQIARFEEHLFGVPRLGAENIAIGLGSTQLTHDLFRTLLDPGDTVMLLDPTYANYEGQLAFSVLGLKSSGSACSIHERGRIYPRPIRPASPASSRGCSRLIARAWCCSARQTIPPARCCRSRSRR